MRAQAPLGTALSVCARARNHTNTHTHITHEHTHTHTHHSLTHISSGGCVHSLSPAWLPRAPSAGCSSAHIARGRARALASAAAWLRISHSPCSGSPLGSGPTGRAAAGRSETRAAAGAAGQGRAQHNTAQHGTTQHSSAHLLPLCAVPFTRHMCCVHSASDPTICS